MFGFERFTNRLPGGVTGTVLAGVLAVGGGAFTYLEGGKFATAMRPPTATEKSIESGIAHAFGTPYTVRCISKVVMASWSPNGLHTPDAFGMTPAIANQHLPIMYVEQSHCDLVTAFTHDPTFPTEDEADALEVITHEYSHDQGRGTASGRATSESNEGITDCEAIQRERQLAKGLGVTADQARDIARLEASTYVPRLPAYDPPEGCRDGGAYDLDPAHSGDFPDMIRVSKWVQQNG